MITENGIADGSDKNRAPYIISHVSEMALAIKDGADVLGYMHWSLIDNWELQEGYRNQSHFGLFHVQRSNVTPDKISTVATGGGSEDGQVGSCGVCSREITVGALAYAYLISQAGHDIGIGAWEKAIASAKAKFGYFSPDGDQLFQPTRGFVDASIQLPITEQQSRVTN
jgi:hypothetical protein